MFNQKEYRKKYYQKQLLLNKAWAESNPEKIKEYKKQYRKNNSEKIRKYMKQYYEKNKEKIRKCMKEWDRDNRRTNLKFNINHRMTTAIWRSLKGNKEGRAWKSLVNYTLNDLIKHLEKTMPKGYAWQDFLDGKLHLDHIVPTSVHNFTKPEHADFKRCWGLKNLRLLPAKENLEKSNRLEKPFQPALNF